MAAAYPRAFPKALPRIRVSLGRRPHQVTHEPGGRLFNLRDIVTSLMEEERIELLHFKAFEARPYAERLIQLAMHYGDRHEPTMEICDFWLTKKELIHKLFKVYVPRFQDYRTSYTRMFNLPKVYQEVILPTKRSRYYSSKMAILELKGNPFPPVIPEPINTQHSLVNILLEEARKAKQSKQLA